ncbi:hypothetical protein M8C13_31105 [Crossiella sp. SN42]|uniref:hypothetical protein n=1 Tax=Crossiella sp. SN42 TaxID=2944808 RepID=UPI00207CD979|nr:hypothetical protein [Crossiella sp. SN42]MCO1580213.1 hypothetical protein [Crossiella sp. SN42]
MPWSLIIVLVILVAGGALVLVLGRLLIAADQALDRAHQKMLTGGPTRWHRMAHHPRRWFVVRCHHCLTEAMEQRRVLREQRKLVPEPVD